MRKTSKYNVLAAYLSLKAFYADISFVFFSSQVKLSQCHLFIFCQGGGRILSGDTLIKCGFDHFAGNVELELVGKACDAFYEVVSVGIHTEDDLLKVMNRINELKIELSYEGSSSVIIEEDSLVQNQMAKILDPATTQSKGRPPSKRL